MTLLKLTCPILPSHSLALCWCGGGLCLHPDPTNPHHSFCSHVEQELVSGAGLDERRPGLESCSSYELHLFLSFFLFLRFLLVYFDLFSFCLFSGIVSDLFVFLCCCSVFFLPFEFFLVNLLFLFVAFCLYICFCFLHIYFSFYIVFCPFSTRHLSSPHLSRLNDAAAKIHVEEESKFPSVCLSF